MALPGLLAHAGSFDTPAAAGPVSYAGVGFTPRVVILIAAGNGNANLGTWDGLGTVAAHTGLSLQWLVADPFTDTPTAGAINEAAMSISSGDAKVYHNVNKTGLTISGAAGGGAIVDARRVTMDADGFTLNYLVANVNRRVVSYLALGGDSLNFGCVEWQMPPPGGVGFEYEVGGLGFRPEVVLSLWGAETTLELGTDLTRAAFGFGAFDREGNQWALSYRRDYTAPGFPTSSAKLFSPSFAVHPLGAWGASFAAMTKTGFRLSFPYGNVQRTKVISLALAGVNARVGTLTKPAATQQQTTPVGFTPSALLLATAGAPIGQSAGIRAAVGLGDTVRQGTIGRIDTHSFSPGAEALKRSDKDKILVGPDHTTATSAALASMETSGAFVLDWTTNDPTTYPVGYIALGAIPPTTGPNRRASLSRFEAEFNGIYRGWTDISEDVLLDDPGFEIRYGIGGTGPADLVASTGTLKFTLNNSEGNSAGLVGYYSPGHPNCRPGFALGLRVRYSYLIPPWGGDGVLEPNVDPDRYGKFVGRVLEIAPEPGRYRDRKTACLAADWFNEAAITRYNAPTQVAKRTDQVLATIVALVPRQPDSMVFDIADSTFPYSLDNGLVERSTVLTEIQRLALSEYGHVYMRGGLNYWGRLVFEKRTKRLTPIPVATFDGTMQALDTGNTTAKIRNRAKVTAHPRRIDAANTTILFNRPPIASTPAIVPAETVRLSGRYVDPNNPNARIGGTDMIPPAATTDYLMNSLANGTGTNLTANFSVVATFGANQVDFAITNNGATPGFLTFLRVRGRGLYDYDPIEVQAEDAASIALIGESGVALDLPYQSDYSVAAALAQFLIASWSSHGGVAETSIKFIPRTFDELTLAMALEPGMPIVVREELSVVSGVYFIQNVTVQGTGDRTAFEFELQRAIVAAYWTLGVAGKSELGQTTVLAPL